MKFERLALERGIQMPRPIEPHIPMFEYVADVDGLGPVRVFEWVEGRNLTAADEIAEWIGLVLANLHSLQSADSPDKESYGLHEPKDWERWFEEARGEWPEVAASGMRSLALIVDASRFIDEAFDRVDDFVLTHRDVEPWNILIGESGPVLLDWDYAGPDSAWLEASYAAISYGRLDSPFPVQDRVRAVVHSYLKHGGRRSCSAPWLLARRAGLTFNRLAFSLWVAVGHRGRDQNERAASANFAADQLAKLPTLLDTVHEWSELI